MHFQVKITFKNNRNHTSKHHLSLVAELWFLKLVVNAFRVWLEESWS